MEIDFAAMTKGAGVALVMLATAFGISKIGTEAVAATARQPEAAGNIRTTAMMLAALIEGAALFGLVICMLI